MHLPLIGLVPDAILIHLGKKKETLFGTEAKFRATSWLTL